ncbi:hypothetical protein ACIBSW_23725 [Actinoplanes sp. NPDC049668]|uniref:hypothetical protein n=1 Tax=unclassified Actinoplanes TaxID=2626549 RepID=UPI0033A95380
MSARTRPALLLATASVAVGLLLAPGAAFAANPTAGVLCADEEECTDDPAPEDECTDDECTDDPAPDGDFGPEELSAAMEAVEAASAEAGAQGWKIVEALVRTPSSGEPDEGEATVQADLVNRRLTWHFTDSDGTDLGGAVDAAKGTWRAPEESWHKSVLAMMGRQTVKYVFTAGKVDFAEYLQESPAAMAADLVERLDDATEVTREEHEDGSADYRVADETGEVTLHVGADSVVTGRDFRLEEGDVAFEDSAAYTYGPQSISMPSATLTVDAKSLKSGRAYLSMGNLVNNAAGGGAANARKAAKGRKVSVASVRSLVRRAAAGANAQSGAAVVQIKDITAGVRVYATNPWTKKSVAYTVTAVGRRVVVKKSS